VDFHNLATDVLEVIREQLPPSFTADVLKALIGSLVGAGLAFWFALRKDRLMRLLAQRAAGNLAVTTLARMTGDFLQVRAALVENRDHVLAEQPHSPVWMLIKPLIWNHAENLHFDVSGLTFIFDHPDGAEVFNKLMTAEIKYHAFFHMLSEHRKATERAQDLLSEVYPDPTEGRAVKEYVTALGFARVARMEALAVGIFAHVDKSEESFLEAGNTLPPLLKKIFKRGVIRFVPPTAEELKKMMA
jgi:hypothetical protein